MRRIRPDIAGKEMQAPRIANPEEYKMRYSKEVVKKASSAETIVKS
jgi:ribosomal protein S30